MINVHYPEPAPVVSRDCELLVHYRFPSGSEVKVRKGEHLTPDRLIAVRDPATAAVRVPVAEQLGVAPSYAARCLSVSIGSTVAVGETLGKHRRGLRNLAVQSPVAGTLLGLDSKTGTALIAPAGAGEIRARMPGEVDSVQGKEGLFIRTVGTRIQGIVGLGEPATGPTRFAVERADELLGVEKVNASLSGAIVIGGRTAGAQAIRRLIEVGAAGLIVGGLSERDLAEAFGWQLEDRLAPWRARSGETAIGGGLPVPLSVVATEGFGSLPMSPAIFEALRALRERSAVLLPRTSLEGAGSRPELIAADADAVERDAPPPTLECIPGTTARLSDQAHLGQQVVVASEPRYKHLGDGSTELVIEVDLTDGGRRTVRTANLEVIA